MAGSVRVALAGHDHPDQLAVDGLQLLEGRLQGAEDFARDQLVPGIRDPLGCRIEGDGHGPAGAAAAATPDVMTVAEAAAYLKVSATDVQALITGGQVKAKQIGSEFRVSKKALNDFLAS